MRKISADAIFTNTGSPLKNTVVIADHSGTIDRLEPVSAHDPVTIEQFRGALIPGFVNAHCHLELSHLKGKVDTGTGLIPFLEKVVTLRQEDQEIIEEAIRIQDQEMYASGIVAVGDISNKTDSFKTKISSKIRYYTFVEMFDFLQDQLALQFYSDYKKVYDLAPSYYPNARSAVPHAPYSVSQSLFQFINELNGTHVTQSIHNQETADETQLFRNGGGRIPALFHGFSFKLPHFRPTGKPSIHYSMENLNPKQRTIFVHNTLTTQEDIEDAHRWSDNVYWATCPNANLYIENKLPDYRIFMGTGARVCIGTDSLTSNWQLSILDEIKTIARYQSFVSTETLISWATLNGAMALGFEDMLGSIEPGKRPGINLLDLDDSMRLKETTKISKIID